MAARRSTSLFPIGLAAALAWACAGATPPPATVADAQRAQARYPGVTVEALEQGRSLYMSRCSRCHPVVMPAKLRPEDWPRQLDKMRERAGLSDEQEALIERYLVTMAAAPPAPSP